MMMLHAFNKIMIFHQRFKLSHYHSRLNILVLAAAYIFGREIHVYLLEVPL